MQTLDYILLDVFTETPLAGNQLAVFPDAGGLAPERMQRIAAELNLSESVFVTGRDSGAHRYEIRIMTPAAELPFAGHPTIGTAVAIASELTLAMGLDAGTLNAVIHQGEEMGRPSRLELAARITDGRAASVTLGGPAVRVGSGRLRVGP